MGLHIGVHRKNIARIVGIIGRRLVPVELIHLIHLIEQREDRSELIVIFIVARAGQYGTELIGAEEADRLPLRAEIILIAGRHLLHPADLFRKADGCKDSCPRNLGRKNQMLPARNNIENRLIDAVTAVAAYILWIIIVIA